jgi:tRNA-2-methylthio-N6-dimethylallyladenosine synthase
MLDAMQRLYTRDQYLERISWMKAAKRDISITSDIIVGFPGETEEDFADTLSLLEEVGYDGIFGFKYSPRPNTPAIGLVDAIPEEEKARRLTTLQEMQRELQRISYRKHIGQTLQVFIEGKNDARKQWSGRTSQNKILNFTVPAAAENTALEIGNYVPVRVTASFPNSLLGELSV